MAKLNVMSSPSTANRLNILGVPFLLIYDNGKLVESTPAMGDITGLRMKMARFL